MGSRLGGAVCTCSGCLGLSRHSVSTERVYHSLGSTESWYIFSDHSWHDDHLQVCEPFVLHFHPVKIIAVHMPGRWWTLLQWIYARHDSCSLSVHIKVCWHCRQMFFWEATAATTRVGLSKHWTQTSLLVMGKGSMTSSPCGLVPMTLPSSVDHGMLTLILIHMQGNSFLILKYILSCCTLDSCLVRHSQATRVQGDNVLQSVMWRLRNPEQVCTTKFEHYNHNLAGGSFLETTMYALACIQAYA